MSSISALKVFKWLGKSPRDSRNTPVKMSSIPLTQPEWLQQILDGHQQVIDASKQVNVNLEKKFDAALDSFRKDFGGVQEKQAETTEKLQAVASDVDSLRGDLQTQQKEVSALDQRVDDTKQDLLVKIDNLRAERSVLGPSVSPGVIFGDRPVPHRTRVFVPPRQSSQYGELLRYGSCLGRGGFCCHSENASANPGKLLRWNQA